MSKGLDCGGSYSYTCYCKLYHVSRLHTNIHLVFFTIRLKYTMRVFGCSGLVAPMRQARSIFGTLFRTYIFGLLGLEWETVAR